MMTKPPKRHAHHSWKYFGIIFIIIIIFVVSCVGWLFWRIESYANQIAVTSDKPVDYVVLAKSNIKKLATDLAAKDVIKHPILFQLYARIHGYAHKLKSGEYEFSVGSTPKQILDQIASGKVVIHRITIFEGWTFAQMFKLIEQDSHIDHTLLGQSPDQVMIALGHAGENPEGRFFPATYSFVAGTKDTMILNWAYRVMQAKLQAQWDSKVPYLWYTDPYQALIVASLIEKETSLLEEKPVVAGVILRRLGLNMLLQVDPTVIYGLGDAYHGTITEADLKLDTPYNTYLHKGLPPTPICLPGKQAIWAALHPVRGTYLYYVATGYGGQFFSSTYASQKQAVDDYRKILGENAQQAAQTSKQDAKAQAIVPPKTKTPANNTSTQKPATTTKPATKTPTTNSTSTTNNKKAVTQ